MEMEIEMSFDDFNDDVRFEVIKNLDYLAINNLCSTNKIFRQFCNEFEGDIYRFLLLRDYNIDEPKISAKVKYINMTKTFKGTLNILRRNNISIIADMIELEFLSQQDKINNVFTENGNYTIIVPDDILFNQILCSWMTDDGQFYSAFGTEFLQNHIGIFDFKSKEFKNLNNITIILPFNLVKMGMASNINIYKVNEIIATDEQYDLWSNYFIVEDDEAW